MSKKNAFFVALGLFVSLFLLYQEYDKGYRISFRSDCRKQGKVLVEYQNYLLCTTKNAEVEFYTFFGRR
jgi:hypothetical protein